MNKNSIKYCIYFILLFIQITEGQNLVEISRLKSNFAKSENKEKYYGNLLKNIEKTFSGKLYDNSGMWIKALRDAQSIQLSSDLVKQGIEKILARQVDSNIKLQRVALEIAYTHYRGDWEKYIQRIFSNTNDIFSFSIAALYLKNNRIVQEYLKTEHERFEKRKADLITNYLLDEIRNETKKIPSLKDLLNHVYQENKTIIFSLHRKNRDYPGITIIRKPNGEFVRNKEGEIFTIPQLALSYSNLPEYLPNGNTPQGIYSIQGTYISPTETIGPTPNVLTRIPYEVSPSLFYHQENKKNNWNIEDYKDLLPLSWRNYDPIFNSFNAGKIGRRLIIIHGSTDETAYFKDEQYFPLTPTRGCLSSKEIWDEDTGRLIESDQVNLINAFRSTGQIKGFLVVVEIDDQERPVNIQEILKFIK